jgi:hypothetical protein
MQMLIVRSDPLTVAIVTWRDHVTVSGARLYKELHLATPGSIG